jgi:hypothetical protein
MQKSAASGSHDDIPQRNQFDDFYACLLLQKSVNQRRTVNLA